MPTLILAGATTEHFRRIKSYLKEENFFSAWDFIFEPSKEKIPGISAKDVSRICEAACQRDSVHVLGVSKQDGKIRQSIALRIRQHFRFRWFDNKNLPSIGSKLDFIKIFRAILDEEERWIESVKPKCMDDALLLPQNSFECDNREMWEYSEAYGDLNNIDSAVKLRKRFTYSHCKKIEGIRRWVDSSGRVFDFSGPRHGKAVCPKNWKYSYRLENGFHYDVSNQKGGVFFVVDLNGTKHKVQDGGHANIDPHGHVR